LLTMYNSGGRVSEITGLSWQQVRFGTTTYLDLTGKGRKERSVPCGPKPLKSFTNGESVSQEAAPRQFSPACVVMY
jgi:site-specific recombinase XerC